MTSSHDECVLDHVITNVDHVITNGVTMDHVITTSPSTPPTIHIILSVDHEHFQGEWYKPVLVEHLLLRAIWDPKNFSYFCCLLLTRH